MGEQPLKKNVMEGLLLVEEMAEEALVVVEMVEEDMILGAEEEGVML